MKGVVLPPHVKFRIRSIINVNVGRKKKEKEPMKKSPRQAPGAEELHQRWNPSESFILGSGSRSNFTVIFGAERVMLIKTQRVKEKVKEAAERRVKHQRGFKWPRWEGEAPLKLRKSKILFFFFQLSSVSGCTVWPLMGSRLKIHKWVCSQPEAKRHPASLHQHVLRAKFRPPELVGRLRFLTDVGRHSSSPAEAVTNTTHFLQEVKRD